MKLKRRTVAVFAIAAALLLLVTAGAVVWRVENALRSSQRDPAQGELLGFEVRTLGPMANPGFESNAAANHKEKQRQQPEPGFFEATAQLSVSPRALSQFHSLPIAVRPCCMVSL